MALFGGVTSSVVADGSMTLTPDVCVCGGGCASVSLGSWPRAQYLCRFVLAPEFLNKFLG